MKYCQFCSCIKCIKERALERAKEAEAKRDKDKWTFKSVAGDVPGQTFIPGTEPQTRRDDA